MSEIVGRGAADARRGQRGEGGRWKCNLLESVASSGYVERPQPWARGHESREGDERGRAWTEEDIPVRGFGGHLKRESSQHQDDKAGKGRAVDEGDGVSFLRWGGVGVGGEEIAADERGVVCVFLRPVEAANLQGVEQPLLPVL